MTYRVFGWLLLLLFALLCPPSIYAESEDSDETLNVRIAAFTGQGKGNAEPDNTVRVFNLPDSKIMETFDLLATRYYQRQISLPAILGLSSINLMCVYTASVHLKDIPHKKFKYRGGVEPYVNLELKPRTYEKGKLALEVSAKYGKYSIQREMVTALLARTLILRKRAGSPGYLFLAITPVKNTFLAYPSEVGRLKKIAKFVRHPRVVKNPVPPYPPDMKSLKISGKVVVGVIVEANGKINPDFVVVLETPYPSFSRSAFNTIREDWVFKPDVQDGRPVDIYANVEVMFALR